MTAFVAYAEMREKILHPRRGHALSTWPFGKPLAEQRRVVLGLIDTVLDLERQLEAARRWHG